MQELTKKLIAGEDLRAEEAEEAMKAMMSGEATHVQMASFLTALRIKGETAEEIAAFARVMRELAEKVRPEVKGIMVDVCGTGGDSAKTFNVSTTSMFVVAAAGVAVAKHGNRSITSRCGSADVLEALGARIDLSAEEIKKAIEEIGIGFMFAPRHHASMKHVMPVRRELGFRTVFNVLGPLSNPADADAQLMGVYDPELTEKLAEVFRQLGVERAMVVCGEPGMDEISNLGETKISELSDGKVSTYTLDPADFGYSYAKIEDLSGGDAAENAKILSAILSGEDSGPRKDIVVLNAAAGIFLGGKAEDFEAALEKAKKTLESGKAYRKMEEFIAYKR